MRLSLLIFCFLQGTCWTSNFYCIYQPKTLSIKDDNSVTVPCSYTYREDPGEKSRIIVTWGERDGPYCDRIKKHITDRSGNIMDEYKDRISIEKHLKKNRTESLLIRGVKASDGVTICCRVTKLSLSGTEYPWMDNYGTSVNFTERNRSYQVEELMAVLGEEMIIPCRYPVKTLQEARKVTWYTGDDILCDYYSTEIHSSDQEHGNDRYSLVNFPESASLRIHRVKENDPQRYCCQVKDQNEQLLKSRFPTELTIAGSSSSPAPFTVTQTEGIIGHEGESVTLNCSYSQYKESDVLGVNIYWRLGNTSGPYIYHPYKEMVRSSYKGRVEITGAADLHIRGLQTLDDSVYYCFVMLKVCVGNDKYERLIQYGNGTRLIMKESPTGLSGYEPIIISVSAVVLLFLLSVIFIILKKKGFICNKKNVQIKTPDSAEKEELSLEEMPYCEISNKNVYNHVSEGKEDEKDTIMEKADDEQEIENILYTELNKATLQPRNPASYPKQEERTVYAAIISPDSRR